MIVPICMRQKQQIAKVLARRSLPRSVTGLNDYERGTPLDQIADPRQGIATTDNNRFLRMWYEVAFDKIGFNLNSDQAAASGLKWFPLNKGGAFRKWYGNHEYVVNYQHDGAEIKENVLKNTSI